MKSISIMKNFFLKSLVIGVGYFFLGWLFYGILFDAYFSSQANPDMMAIRRPDDGMLWWALILGSLCYGLLIGFVIARAKIDTFWCHVRAGAITRLFFSLTANLMNYSMLEMMSFGALWVDVIIMTVISGLLGAAAALVHTKTEEPKA